MSEVANDNADGQVSYVFTTLEQIAHVDLTARARLAYLLVLNFKEAWFSVPTLARLLGGCSLSTARQALEGLEKAGLIYRDQRRGQTSIYRVLPIPHRESGGVPHRESGAPPAGNPAPKQKEKQKESKQLRPLVDNPSAEDPAREVAQSDLKPDNPPAPQRGSSSSTSARLSRFVGSRVQDPPRGALISGLRKAEPAPPLELPVDLEAALVRGHGHDQVHRLKRRLGQGQWVGQADVATMAARLLLERNPRDLDRYVGALLEEARERLAAPPPPAAAVPKKLEHHRDELEIEIAELKRRIRDAPLHPKKPQYERQLAEQLERQAARLGARAAS